MTAPLASFTTPEIVLWAEASDGTTTRTTRGLKRCAANLALVMSSSSAEPTVMPRAQSNSAIRRGAVCGESLQPCRPRRDRSARFRALDDFVQDGNEQQTRARSVGNVAHPRE